MAYEGMFCWYDLMTTDRAAAEAFYGAVVGWTFKDSGMPGPQPYMLIQAGDRQLAGLMQLSDEMCSAGARTGWMGHILVADVDAKAAQTAQLGGAVHRPPADIPGVGRFAIVADPTGSVFSLFQAAPEYPVPPPPPMDTPAWCGWRELHAGSLDVAWPFYEAMFGWKKAEAFDMGGPVGVYQTFRFGFSPDDSMGDGGMMTKMPDTPVPHWLYYFNVDAASAAVDRIKAGGGQVLMGPMEVPGGGWIAVALDPQGGAFAVLADKA